MEKYVVRYTLTFEDVEGGPGSPNIKIHPFHTVVVREGEDSYEVAWDLAEKIGGSMDEDSGLVSITIDDVKSFCPKKKSFLYSV